MAKTNGAKTEPAAAKTPVVAEPEPDVNDAVGKDAIAQDSEPSPETTTPPDTQDIEDCLNALKSLLSTVEKLQKVRQEVGDIKPLLVRMLDGEVLTGDELEQLKTGVGGLFKLVRAYSDHQTALSQAQPARSLLDQVLKPVGSRESSDKI